MTIPWNQEADAIVAALLNGTFQGAVLCGMIWVVMHYCRGLNASTRYLIWLGVLGWICLLPFSHFLLARTGVGQDDRPVMADRSTPVHVPGTSDTLQTQEQSPASFEHPSFINPPEWTQKHSSSPLPEKDFTTTWADSASLLQGEEIPETPGMSDASSKLITATESEFSAPSPLSDAIIKTEFSSPFQSKTFETLWPPFLSLSLLSVVGLIIAFKWIRLLLDLIQLTRLKKEALALSIETARYIETSNLPLQSRRHVRVKMHPTIKTPLALGFFRPTILLPQSLAESTDESKLACILRHEWAHIARYDDWTNLIQRFLEAMFFFHPAVAYIGRRLDTEREIACDDHVLADGSRAKDYALMLTQFANRERDRHLATATAGWNKKHQIKERIDMLLDYHRNTAPRPARVGAGLFTLATLAVGIIAMSVSPRLALAQTPRAEVTQSPSTANDLFEDQIAQPRVKDKNKNKNKSKDRQPEAIQRSQRSTRFQSSSLLSAPESKESIPGLGDDHLAPAFPTESAIEVPQIPNMPRVPFEMEVPVEDQFQSSDIYGAPNKSTAQSRQLRRVNSNSQISQSGIAQDPTADLDPMSIQSEDSLNQLPEAASIHPYKMQTRPAAKQTASSSQQDNELEQRLKVLESLVHRLIQAQSEEKASQQFPTTLNEMFQSQFNNKLAGEYMPDLGIVVSPDPFIACSRKLTDAEKEIADAMEKVRLANLDTLRGWEKLQQERAALEAERQQLNDRIKALDRRAETLHLKMAQEIEEIESIQSPIRDLGSSHAP